MSPSATNVIRLLAASMAIVLAAALLNFIVDPLQLLRPARFFPAMYSNDTRMQNAGLIRSRQFDTAFMGTSMAIHFRQHEIDGALGVRSLKLAMTGANSRVQSFVLAAAMERPVKRVVWQVDDWSFIDSTEIDSDVYMPAHLYRRNLRGIAGYLLSGAMARESLWIAARALPLLEPVVARLTSDILFRFPIADVDDIHALPAGFDIAAAYNADKAISAFRHITAPVRNKYLATDYDYDTMVKTFERDTVGLIEAHPDVMFDLYFPPYSILQFVAMRDASPATLKTVYDFTAYAFPRLTQFSNVRLHDFRAIAEVTHDLSNYGDVIHHSPAVDRKVLSWLASGKYLVDRAAPLASLERLKGQVDAFQLER